MTKLEVLKLLNEEVGLFIDTEDEDLEGDTYIASRQFKEVGTILTELAKLRDKVKVREEKLKKIINSEDRFIIVKSKTELIEGLRGVDAPYLIVDSENIIFTNCIFSTDNFY